jgi:hypothetical protein
LLQAADELVDLGLVAQVGEDGGFLRVTADEAKRLPAFVRQAHVEVEPDA